MSLAIAEPGLTQAVEVPDELPGGISPRGIALSAALHIVLGGYPDRTRVAIDPGLSVSAKTVGELRKVTVWPENLAITTPPDQSPDDIIRVPERYF